MRVEKINFLPNFRLNQSTSVKRPALSFKGDVFEKRKYPEGSVFSDIIKFSVDWGWYFNDYSEGDSRVYYPNQRKLNILNGDDEHLKDVAESISMYTDDDLKKFASVFNLFSTRVNEEKSKKAHEKLMPYIEAQRAKIKNMLDVKYALEAKKRLSAQDKKVLSIVNNELKRLYEKAKHAPVDYLKSQLYTKSDEAPDEGIFY